jgi:hypothetical protein
LLFAATEPIWKSGLAYLSYGVTVVTVLTAAVTFATRQIRRRMLWGMFGKGDEVTIYLPGRDVGRKSLAVATEDFYAAHVVATFLQRRGFQCDFQHVGPSGHLFVEAGPAIVICGPKSSPTVQELLWIDETFGFVQSENGWELLDKVSGEHLPSPCDLPNPRPWDHAYIGVLPRADDDFPRVLLIAGIHAIGSLGAANLLTRRGTLVRLWWKQWRALGASAIVTSEHELEPPRVGNVRWLRQPRRLTGSA